MTTSLADDIRNQRMIGDLQSLAAVLAIFLVLCQVAGTAHSHAGQRITFNPDVAPIFLKNCSECHRPDDLAPFSVLSYKDVRPWARAIREKVIAREMPPWHADPRFGTFTNDARLSQKDVDTIVAWVDQGAKEGDPNLHPLPADRDDGWKIGKPDLIVSMTEDYTIKPDDPDNYVYFMAPAEFKEDTWVQAAEVRPGNKKLVHHVIAHVLTPQAMAASSANTGPPEGESENTPSIFYKEGGLARVRMNAPVTDDGASTPNGGSVIKRRSAKGADLFSILLTSYAPGKGPDVFLREWRRRSRPAHASFFRCTIRAFGAVSTCLNGTAPALDLSSPKSLPRSRLGPSQYRIIFSRFPQERRITQ